MRSEQSLKIEKYRKLRSEIDSHLPIEVECLSSNQRRIQSKPIRVGRGDLGCLVLDFACSMNRRDITKVSISSDPFFLKRTQR